MRNFLLCLALLCSLSAQSQRITIEYGVDSPTFWVPTLIPQWQDTMGRIEITRTPNILNPVFFYTPDPNFYIRIDTGPIIPNTHKPDLHLPEAKPYNWRKGALVAGFGLVAGLSYGLNQMSAHHPSDLPSGWNRDYWDASISWQNKYRNGDPSQGPKFALSTTALVWTTDGYHMTSTVHKAALLGAGITIGFGEKRKWWEYGADLVLGFAAYNIGFHSVYTYQMLGR